MDDAEHGFIEDMGQHMVGWGLPRSTGRIYAFLLLQPGPASLDQIATDLEMAKSGASVATRQLVQLGLARGVGQRGSRRLLYEALTNLEGIYSARMAQTIDLMERLRQGARAAPPSSPVQERLEDMADAVRELVDDIPALMQRMRERRRERVL